VELLVEEGPKRPIRPETRVKSASGAAGADRVPARTAVTSGPPNAEPKPIEAVSKPPAVTPPAAAPTETRAPARVERPHAQAAEPSGPRSTTPASRPSAENGARSAEPARSQSPVPPPARASETPRPADGDGTDGAAAVDWLLKSRR
jgi:hypothetical protein